MRTMGVNECRPCRGTGMKDGQMFLSNPPRRIECPECLGARIVGWVVRYSDGAYERRNGLDGTLKEATVYRHEYEANGMARSLVDAKVMTLQQAILDERAKHGR